MTSPSYLQDNPDELRQRWLNRYIRVQAKTDTRIRTVLIEGAEDVYKEIESLASSQTFSDGVKRAQLRMVMQQVRSVLNDVFGQFVPIINDGSKQAAKAAVDAFTETDRQFLELAFAQTASASGISVAEFVEGQRRSAMLGVANTVSRLSRSEQPLSGRVYRTKYLANQWVQRQVNSGILRNASAKEIAKTVRKSIRPSTPGGVSYASLRLARTELNNAFHATSIALSEDRPWVESMAWNLSKVHDYNASNVPEICEIYGKQTFKVNQVPSKPHPQCRCFVTPQLQSFDLFVRDLTAGQYTDWIKNAA